MRGILTVSLDPSSLAQDEFKERRRSVRELPHVPAGMPRRRRYSQMMIEAKGRICCEPTACTGSIGFVARFDKLSSLGARSARWQIGRSAIARPAGYWRKRLGIAQGRKLPRFAPRTFCALADRRRSDAPRADTGRKVLYFVDTLRQLSRSATGRSLGGGDGAQQRRRVCTSRSETQRNGYHFDGVAWPGAHAGDAQYPFAGRGRAARISHRCHRAFDGACA